MHSESISQSVKSASQPSSQLVSQSVNRLDDHSISQSANKIKEKHHTNQLEAFKVTLKEIFGLAMPNQYC